MKSGKLMHLWCEFHMHDLSCCLVPPNIGPSAAVDDGLPDHYGTMDSPPSAIGNPPPDSSINALI